MIPFFKPQISKADKTAVLRVLSSGQWTQGEEVELFEQEFAKYIGAPYVVAVDNCTNALWLALKYLKPQIVECPAMTFASVAHAINQTGHIIQFVDEYHAGSAYKLGNTNIWDCAHEVKKFESGQVMCYSFYPNKLLFSMEGGAIATDNKDFAEWLKLARNNGRHGPSYHEYDIEFAGWKMNMTNIQAALAREQLKTLDVQLADRENIRQVYLQELEQINRGNYLFVMKVKDRDEFIRRFKLNNIEVSYHYKPLYDQPAYKNCLLLNEDGTHKYPLTESLKNNIVTLPLYPKLKNIDIQRIIKYAKLYR